MATAFATSTDWFLDRIDPALEEGPKIPDGESGQASSGYHWERQIYVIYLHREGTGIDGFTPKMGQTAVGNTLSWVNGGETMTASASSTYKCTDNGLEPIAPGLWRENITWRWESAWYQAPNSAVPPV